MINILFNTVCTLLYSFSLIEKLRIRPHTPPTTTFARLTGERAAPIKMSSVRGNMKEIHPYIFEAESVPDSDEESVVHQNWWLVHALGMISAVQIFNLFMLLACNWQWLPKLMPCKAFLPCNHESWSCCALHTMSQFQSGPYTFPLPTLTQFARSRGGSATLQ